MPGHGVYIRGEGWLPCFVLHISEFLLVIFGGGTGHFHILCIAFLIFLDSPKTLCDQQSILEDPLKLLKNQRWVPPTTYMVNPVHLVANVGEGYCVFL